MKYLGDNSLTRIALFLLIFGIMSFGVLSIITMNHETVMVSTDSIISQSNSCSDSHDAQSCLDYHLGIMHNLSTATHSGLGVQLITLFVFSFIGLLVLILFKFFEYGYVRQRIRLRQLNEKTIMAFALQLGQWLALFEKRDPSYAFVIA